MTEEELQKLFKSKLDNRDFEFNPDNWKAMEAMLDKKNTRAGGFYWRSVAAVLGLGILVGSLLFLEPGTPAGENLTNDDTEQRLAPGSPESMEPMEEKALEEKAAAPSEQPISTGTNGNNISEGKELGNVGQRSNSVEEAKDRVANSNSNPPSTITSAVREDAGESVLLASGSQTGTPNTKELEGLLLDAKGLAAVGFIVPELDLAPVPAPHEHITAIPTSSSFRPMHQFAVVGGALISDAHSEETMAGIGWHGGVAYKLGFVPRLALSLGVNYSVQNDVGISESKDSIFFHFGKEVVETDRLASRLEYLEVPISISFQLHPDHEIEAGGYMAQLVSVSEDFERRHHRTKAPTQVSNSSTKGYNPDFRKYDYGVTFGYRYNIRPALSIGIELRQGLTDITKDVSDDFAEIHQNLNTRVTLKYRLF